MAVRRMGVELVFNLQWQNKPDNGDDKANFMGMYDTLATTQNFETFKSYLLTNSGVAGNDVKVTYITDNDGEWVIDSQSCFEIALCAFRLKARLGEVIFLKLDKISERKPKLIRKISNDVETQYEHGNNEPPEWFINYMKQFKKDVVEEVTNSVATSIVQKPNASSTPAIKKHKSESGKRSRKHLLLGENPIDKELLKTLKYDRKLEIKLDKLDAKTKKIKEKKMALIFKSNEGEILNKDDEIQIDDGLPQMNAAVITESMTIPHMLGGERYLHTWEVMNNGKLQWTSKTELRLTWGSVDMKPAVKNIPVPKLKPGENGFISVLFQIPESPGQYESYWNFYDKNVRFGHYLNFCAIVDPPINSLISGDLFSSKKIKIDDNRQNTFPDKENVAQSCSSGISLVLPNGKLVPVEIDATGKNNDDLYSSDSDNQKNQKIKIDDNRQNTFPDKESVAQSCSSGISLVFPNGETVPVEFETSVKNIDDKIDDLYSSDSDNQSTLSIALSVGSNDFPNNDEFVLVPNSSFRLSKEDEERLTIDLDEHCRLKSPIQFDKNTSRDEPLTVLNDIVKEKDENVIIPQTSDDNNNNGPSSNRTSSESICKLGTETPSELSYNMDDDPTFSDCVVVSLKGNKYVLPKKILHPELLAECSSNEITIKDESVKKNESVVVDKIDESDQRSHSNTPEKSDDNNVPELESYISHCSAAGSCFSDVNAAMNEEQKQSLTRLFIFPQNNPGFEVVYPPKATAPEFIPVKTIYPQLDNSTREVNCPTNKVEVLPSDPLQIYTWAHSDTKYTVGDVQKSLERNFSQQNPTPQSSRSSTSSTTFHHIPNFQQSGNADKAPSAPPQQQSPPPPPLSDNHVPQEEPHQPVHILPENLVTGAVNVASSAINTARSVINMIVPPRLEPGRCVGGRPDSLRIRNLIMLEEMGFWDIYLNATLLDRYKDDVARVINELVQ